MDQASYFLSAAAAFVRGRCRQGFPVALTNEQLASPLQNLCDDQLTAIFQVDAHAGLKLHKFKRTMGLPRVRRVLGTLHSLAPENLLDVGSGRGVFLWPLLEAFRDLAVTAIDAKEQRANDLKAIHLGGVDRLSAYHMDVTKLSFENDAFDVVSMLEVLEHVPAAVQAVAEIVRVARRFIVLSVPSKPDDNPEHIEAHWDELQRHNKTRADSVPASVLRKLVNKLDVPNLTEAHTVDICCNQ